MSGFPIRYHLLPTLLLVAKPVDTYSKAEPLPAWDYPGSPLLETLACLNASPSAEKISEVTRDSDLSERDPITSRKVLGDVTNIRKSDQARRITVRPRKSRTRTIKSPMQSAMHNKELPIVPESPSSKERSGGVPSVSQTQKGLLKNRRTDSQVKRDDPTLNHHIKKTAAENRWEDFSAVANGIQLTYL